jgi:hypothetical protein
MLSVLSQHEINILTKTNHSNNKFLPNVTTTKTTTTTITNAIVGLVGFIGLVGLVEYCFYLVDSTRMALP